MYAWAVRSMKPGTSMTLISKGVNMALTRAEQEARLPKWARDELKKLRFKNDQLRNSVAERDSLIMEQHPGTNVFLNSGIHEDRPLPRNSQVSFRFGDRWDDAINVYHDREANGTLYVASLQGGLMVYPRSGNAIRLGRNDY